MKNPCFACGRPSARLALGLRVCNRCRVLFERARTLPNHELLDRIDDHLAHLAILALAAHGGRTARKVAQATSQARQTAR